MTRKCGGRHRDRSVTNARRTARLARAKRDTEGTRARAAAGAKDEEGAGVEEEEDDEEEEPENGEGAGDVDASGVVSARES